MEFRQVGRSGLTVSVLGLGTNNLGLKLDLEQSREVVHAALDAGITFFDTADAYGAAEERLGQLLKGQRDDVVIATKFGTDVRRRGLDNGEDWGARGSRRYIHRAIDSSLRRLDTDWIDLYQLHRPDPLTPIEETLSALDDLVRAGKVRYVGSSGFTGWQVAEAEWTSRTRHLHRFVSAQNEYNWLQRDIETDLVPALMQYDVGLLPYYPLAGGLLTGKYRRGEPPPAGSRIEAWGQEALMTNETFELLDAVEGFAQARGATMLQVAMGGLAAQPMIASVMAGATSREQVQRNVAAVAWRPTSEDLATLRSLTA